MIHHLRYRLPKYALASILVLLLAVPARPQGNTVGLRYRDPAMFEGYTFFSPMSGTRAYLLDSYGRLVHSWSFSARPNLGGYLLEGGSVIRSLRPGSVQLMDWDGNMIWDYTYTDETPHHDIAPLPNGNVIITARETMTQTEAIQAGRDPAILRTAGLTPDYLVEVAPTGPTSGVVVWEWHFRDHLIQDFDATKDNYGVVEDHPELFDANFDDDDTPNFTHINGVDYNPEFDQIVISVRNINEVLIIDHSTTSAEAAGHTGGNSGKGGDLLYRWGNPASYRHGDASDQQLFNQHNAHWIPEGSPGAGNILIFNNRVPDAIGLHSAIVELALPVDESGNYTAPGATEPYGPLQPVWIYESDPPEQFFSNLISGAQRLPNGNTLICEGATGRFFEVTEAGALVWEYVNPMATDVPIVQGQPAAQNNSFRCYRFSADSPALAGLDLTGDGLLETYPVRISRVRNAPRDPDQGDRTFVTAAVSDGTSGVSSVALRYSVGSAFVSIAMFDDGNHGDGTAGDGTYGGDIPPGPPGTSVSYYVEAEYDGSFLVTDPPLAPSVTYQYTVHSCCTARVGDANGSGDDQPTIGDISALIDAKFITGSCDGIIACPLEADINQSGGPNATCDDITIGDISILIDYLFIAGPNSFGPLNDCY